MFKAIRFVLIVFVVLIAAGIFLIVSTTSKQKPTTSSPVVTQSPSPAETANPSQTKQMTWKVSNPSNHTFVSPDKTFQFVYPQEWVYETIDGIIPQQQHIVHLGRQLTPNERQQMAQQAGIPLNDSLSGISYTTQDITLYYTNTPDFQVQKPEDLASGTILSKKQITVAKIPAVEAKTDCPTECTEVLFVKGQQTFTFLMARPRSNTTPLNTKKLTDTLATFTFLQ